MRSNTKQEFQEVESKIKSAVERDKILYKKLKKNKTNQNYNNNLDNQKEYTHPRNQNYTTELKSDYIIEYDKSLKPKLLREKSIEKKVKINSQTKNEKRSNNASNTNNIKAKNNDNKIEEQKKMKMRMKQKVIYLHMLHPKEPKTFSWEK